MSHTNNTASSNYLDYTLEIAKGQANGHDLTNSVGRCTTVTTTEGTVWGLGGGTRIVYPLAEGNLYLVSTDNSDTGTLFLVDYLDQTFTPRQTFAVTNGQTPVLIATDVFRMGLQQVQFNAVQHAGTVYFTTDNTTTAGVPDDLDTVLAVSLPEDQRALTAVVTVPRDKTLFTWKLALSADNGANNNTFFGFRLHVPGFLDNVRGVEYTIGDQSFTILGQQFVPFPAGTDIELTARQSSNDPNNRIAQTSFWGFLVDNTVVSERTLITAFQDVNPGTFNRGLIKVI